MRIAGHDVGVCSWSLQPRDVQDLVSKVQQTGLQHVQLALGEWTQWDDRRRQQAMDHLRAANIQFTGGMMAFAGEDYSTIERIRQSGGYVSDADWPLRKRLSVEGARIAKDLGIRSITTHVGFVPPPGDPDYHVILLRIAELAAAFSALDVDLLMETGQEPALELLHFLDDLKASNVFINFDPANMIMYGAGDPIQAIKILGPHIRHVHVKDATPSDKPGMEWGEEVPFGTGAVGPKQFLAALKEAGYTGPLAIEREAGNNRMGDVQVAVETLKTI